MFYTTLRSDRNIPQIGISVCRNDIKINKLPRNCVEIQKIVVKEKFYNLFVEISFCLCRQNKPIEMNKVVVGYPILM